VGTFTKMTQSQEERSAQETAGYRCSVMVEGGDRLVIVRAAPRAEAFVPSIFTWMNLAKATPYRSDRDRGEML
jgi:hypothetical protein